MAANPNQSGERSHASRTVHPRAVSTCPHRTDRLRSIPAAPDRRRFLVWIAALPFAAAGFAMLRRLRDQRRPPPVVIAPDVPVGVTFASDVVVNRSPDGNLRAFAARCTHLGCRLERVLDGVIVCSCHGSRFHTDGRVAAGPAARPLAELRVERDATTGGWTVHVG
jgi:nitrite reductase/ring-hydroxylating ferredoxin subunit